MKAIVHKKYGSPDVLELEEMDKPTPGENEVLVKIRAAAANPLDWHYMRASPIFMRLFIGLLKPKNQFLGADFAGVVEAVGAGVEAFKPGDEVYGSMSKGGFAEYVSTNERNLSLKPANMSFGEAAAVPVAALTALQCLRDQAQIQPGQKVLINGASGGVGTYAVQIAKHFGAEVTGVCSARNVEMVRSIGADAVIDYTNEDFAQSGQGYDLIFDNVGNRSLSDIQRVLRAKGTYILNGFSPSLMMQLMLNARRAKARGQRLENSVLAKVKQSDLDSLREMIEAGKVVSVIDRVYPLSEVPDAIRYLEEGHVRGKIVISMDA